MRDPNNLTGLAVTGSVSMCFFYQHNDFSLMGFQDQSSSFSLVRALNFFFRTLVGGRFGKGFFLMLSPSSSFLTFFLSSLFSLSGWFAFLVNHVSKFLIPDGEMFCMQPSFPEKLTELFIIDAGGLDNQLVFLLGCQETGTTFLCSICQDT